MPSAIDQPSKRLKLHPGAFIVLAALYLALTANLSVPLVFWRAPDAGTGLGRWLFSASGWLLAWWLVAAVLLLLSLPFGVRGTRVLVALSLLVAAPLGYFALFYGVRFDRSMLVNVLETHVAEARDLIGWRLVLWFLVLGVAPAFLVLRLPLFAPRPIHDRLLRLGMLFVVLTLSLSLALLQYQRFASAGRNKTIAFYDVAPINLLAAAGTEAVKRLDRPPVREPVGTDARVAYALPKPRLVVFVLGETARAQNFSWNGYERETSPRMRALDPVFFPTASACGTTTATSVPCIFSGLGSNDYSYRAARARETLIDVVARAGVRVLWRDNDAGCKGVCERAEYEDFNEAGHPLWCRQDERGECWDEILLEGLEAKLLAQPRDTLVVLHLKGSHGPAYFKRYPPAFERFTPACRVKELSACTTEGLVNAYDNTIVYTDHVLGETQALLARLADRFSPVLLYASDHGESLGELGLFLHGTPRPIAPETQTRVPMLAWVSSEFIARAGWNEACVRSAGRPGKGHDNLYPTLLGLLGIQTVAYRAELDLFAGCAPSM
ncbi:MAG: phosphoethanolamine transferase [Casimicrobiaceae bacterium]